MRPRFVQPRRRSWSAPATSFLAGISIVFVSFLSLQPRSRSAETEARQTAAQWIAAGAKLKSLEASFVQERQLKALRQPLSKPGKLWFQRPSAFRWQIGEPPAIIAVRYVKGGLTVADMKARKATQWSAEALDREIAERGGQGFAMMAGSFAASLEEFEKIFEIKSAAPTKALGQMELLLALRDKKAALVVKEISFLVQPATGALDQFELRMRDGSILRTRITAARRDAAPPPGAFVLDTSGCEIEQHR
jgi:outer membrane lipoprotein-sorting protein